MVPLRSLREDELPLLGPADVVGRLIACHANIRRYLAEARALATGNGDPEKRRESARSLARYFGVAMPLHEADEDASIAPRLTGRAAEQALARMEEHAAMDEAVGELCGDWERWLAADMPSAPFGAEHRGLVEAISRAMDTHLALEERHIFPAIAALSEAQRREIVQEMEARRR